MDVILLFDMSQVYGILFVDLNMERKVFFSVNHFKSKRIMSILTTIQLFVENNTSLYLIHESNWIESVWLFHFSTIHYFCFIIAYAKDWSMLAKSMWVVLMNVEESQSVNES